MAREEWDAEPDTVGEAEKPGRETVGPPIYDILVSIENFETPRNRTDVRTFIRLAKMVADIDPNLSQGLSRMHTLLKHGTTWAWNDEVDKEFRLAKSMLSTCQWRQIANSIPPTGHEMGLQNTDNDAHSNIYPDLRHVGDHG